MPETPAHLEKRPLEGTERRNFWLCVGNGAVVAAGHAFFAWETVIAGLCFMLTGSEFLVGVLISVSAIGWQWPQLLVGSRIEHVERKMPIYKLSALLRVFALGAMLLCVMLLPGRPMLLFWLILLWTAILSSAGGICVIPFMDIVAKTIPPHHRPMLFAWRRFLGGLLGFLAGIATLYVLSPKSGLRYPQNYGILLLAGFSLCALAYSLFMRTSEPAGLVLSEPRPFAEFMRRGVALFRIDRQFRRYFLYRVFLSFAVMSQVLLVPFVIEHFGAPLEDTGRFAAVVALMLGLSSMAWGRLTQRHGELWLFRAATLLLLLAPATALALALAARHPALAPWAQAYYLPVCLFVFGCQTAARNGIDIGGVVFMLGLPPPEERPIYMAFMNTLSAPLTLAPALAGIIAATSSYATAFAVSTLASMAALLFAIRLGNPER